MKRLMIALASVAIVGMAFLQPANATIVTTSATVTITQIHSFSDSGSGDVVFTVSTALTGCAGGFWLRPSDAGFKAIYSSLLLSYANHTPILISAYNDSIWTGSTANYCRVYDFNLAPLS